MTAYSSSTAPDGRVTAIEAGRIAALKRYGVLDTPPDASFDRITAFVARMLSVPIAILTLVDADRIWFKSRYGLETPEVPRDPGLCASAILYDKPWVIENASEDPRAFANPLVSGSLGLRFYAAVPLRSSDGFNLGTLCVIDREPRSLTPDGLAILEDMAALVMHEMELRMEARTAVATELALRRQVLMIETANRVAESETRRRFALDSAQIGDWEMDLRTNVAVRSLRHDQCFGYNAPVPVWGYDTFLAHVHPNDRAEVDRKFQFARTTGGPYDVEFRVIWPDGSVHWLLSKGCFFHDSAGTPVRVVGIQIDLTQHKEAQFERDRLALVVAKITTPVMITDAGGRITWVNDAFTKMTGYDGADVAGRTPGSFLQGADTDRATIKTMHDALAARIGFEVDVLNYRKDGASFWQHIKADPVADASGAIASYISVQSDVTSRKNLEALLWNRANYDLLTGLPNRRLFWDRLDQEIRHARRTEKSFALLFIDLDRFKETNDLYGHEVGDLVLQEAATRIRNCVRDTDTAARIGGDEFTVILSELGDGSQVDNVVRKLLDVLSAQFTCHKTLVRLSASIGIAVYPDDARVAEELFKSADQAMYVAKTSGKDQFSYFTSSMQERSQRRLHIGLDLRSALSRRELCLHYQPIIDLATGRIMKLEALLRWHHPGRGAIDPAEFIPLAEELGLIDAIGEWVFQQAAASAEQWSRECGRPLQVSVNKSAMQFITPPGHDSWPRQLKSRNIPGSQITVEITEGVLLRDSKAVIETLAEYRAAGMEVALDDFGTGYSSMAYLQKFSIDYLKIDQSFIANLQSPGSRTISEAIIVMGHKLGLKVIAEGIETPAQRAILLAAGCDFGQGFLFSRAVPPEAIRIMLLEDLHF